MVGLVEQAMLVMGVLNDRSAAQKARYQRQKSERTRLFVKRFSKEVRHLRNDCAGGHGRCIVEYNMRNASMHTCRLAEGSVSVFLGSSQVTER